MFYKQYCLLLSTPKERQLVPPSNSWVPGPPSHLAPGPSRSQTSGEAISHGRPHASWERTKHDGGGRGTRESILGNSLVTACVGESLLTAESMSQVKRMVGGGIHLKWLGWEMMTRSWRSPGTRCGHLYREERSLSTGTLPFGGQRVRAEDEADPQSELFWKPGTG